VLALGVLVLALGDLIQRTTDRSGVVAEVVWLLLLADHLAFPFILAHDAIAIAIWITRFTAAPLVCVGAAIEAAALTEWIWCCGGATFITAGRVVGAWRFTVAVRERVFRIAFVAIGEDDGPFTDTVRGTEIAASLVRTGSSACFGGPIPVTSSIAIMDLDIERQRRRIDQKCLRRYGVALPFRSGDVFAVAFIRSYFTVCITAATGPGECFPCLAASQINRDLISCSCSIRQIKTTDVSAPVAVIAAIEFTLRLCGRYVEEAKGHDSNSELHDGRLLSFACCLVVFV